MLIDNIAMAIVIYGFCCTLLVTAIIFDQLWETVKRAIKR